MEKAIKILAIVILSAIALGIIIRMALFIFWLVGELVL